VSYPTGDVRDLLAHVGREAVRAGLVIGSGGNLSARDPGAEACWVTASGTWLDRLDRRSFSLVRIADGAVLDGNPKPSSEVLLHLHTYRRRPDVNALVHLHPQTSVLLDSMGYDVSLVTIDHAYYLREVRRTPFVQSGTEELAVTGAEAVADGANAVVLGHHGCSVLGGTVEEAHKRAFNLEEAAKATYAALVLAGGDASRVPSCPPEYLETVRRKENAAADGEVRAGA
jgi:L-fuculose-phosphate aldolase